MAYEFPFRKSSACVFLDSGIGGLPYLQELKRLSPKAPCIYVADTANFPYGEKTASEICEAASELVKKVIFRFHPAVIVLACNTMSVTALDYLRKHFPVVPFVGTVPAIKKAAALSKNKVIGLLASGDTVRSPYTAGLISDFASDCKVIKRVATRLIRAIERRLVLADEATQIDAIRPFVQAFIDKGADTVVLGCTHFLHLRDAFCKALGRDIQVADSLEGVAQQALRLLEEAKEENGMAERREEQKKLDEAEAPINYLLTTSGLTTETQLETYMRCRSLYGLEPGGLI